MSLATYISFEGNKVLFNNNGIPVVKFKYGQAIADVNFDVQAPNSKTIQYPHPALDGVVYDPATCTAQQREQMAGLGNLATVAGRKDDFRIYESPILTGTSGTVAAVAGTVYLVVAGTVTYKSVVYKAGTTFVADGSITATEGTGKYRIWFPLSWTDGAAYTTEAFRIAHLGNPDDALSYWTLAEPGFVAQADSYVR